MYKLSINLLTVTLLAISSMPSSESFSDKIFTGRYVEKFADSKPNYEVNIRKGKKEGLEVFYCSNGSKQSQTSYVEDKEDGVWNQWQENGQLKLEASYQAGQGHGVFTQWYESKQKKFEANFIHGKKEGIKYVWAKDGSIKSTSLYKDGQVVAE